MKRARLSHARIALGTTLVMLVMLALGMVAWPGPGSASARTVTAPADGAVTRAGAPTTHAGAQFGSIGAYGEVWRGGGFDASAFDHGRYDKPLTPGRFVDPVGFAVDTGDQTPGGDGTAVYVLDRTSDLPAYARNARTTWRLQKLDDRGRVLGTSEFSLPADGDIYEMAGLAVDPATGTVYALLLTFDLNLNTEAVAEILGWSTTPAASGRLVAPGDLATDTVSTGIARFPTPGVLSTAEQLSSNGSSLAYEPQGLTRDVRGRRSLPGPPGR